MVDRSFKSVLEAGPALGFCSMYASAGIVERAAPGWDWCWIDAQHGEWGPHNAVEAVRACDLAGVFSLVRVPGHDAATLGRVLDTACHAVMVPMVDTPVQAEAVVRGAHFAPLGRRSYGGRRPIDRHGRAYAHADRPQPLLVCQIETEEGLRHADAIAAVAGVDALFFGPDDLAQGRGLPMDAPRPAGCFDAELGRVAAAARRAGKLAGGIFTTPDALRAGVALGYRLIVGGGDVPLLAGSAQAARACREAVLSGASAAAGNVAGPY